jgi:Spy/CpxP family protein refolding chaperone
MKNYLKAIAAACMLFGLVQVTMAQPGPGYGQGYHRRGLQGEGPGQGLRQGPGAGQAQCQQMIPNLTEEQETQIASLRLTHLKEIQPLKSEMAINRAKIDALMIQDNPDMKALNALIEANGKLRTEIQQKNVAQRLAVRKLLTDEQKISYDSGKGRGRMPMPDRACRFRDFQDD